MSGSVVWLTGLPSSGKSLLAVHVAEQLRKAGRPSCILDGDRVRDVMVPRPGYSEEARDEFYATLAGFAGLLARQGLVVLVPATAHRRAFRERARGLAPRFIEVYLDVALETCARRDAKGLYARARAGEVGLLPGAGAAYEPPEAPEVVASGGEDTVARDRIIELVYDGANAFGKRAM